MFTSDKTSSHAFLGMREIEVLTGLSRSTIYRMRLRGDFPKGEFAWGRTHRWRQDTILRWLHGLIAEKRERKRASAERKKEKKRLKARIKPPGWAPKPKGRPKKKPIKRPRGRPKKEV